MIAFNKNIPRIRFITLIIPFFLVFLGMKVPDFSTPHKPKPIRRAVLNKTPIQESKQSIVKITLEPVTPSFGALVFFDTVKQSLHVQSVHTSIPVLTLSALPPRASPGPSTG